MTEQEKNRLILTIEEYQLNWSTDENVLDMGEVVSEYEYSWEYLCFINDDLVHFTEIRHQDEEWFRIDGINNDIHHLLGQWIESFHDIVEIEEYFESKPKFLHYIKTNLMSWVSK